MAERPVDLFDTNREGHRWNGKEYESWREFPGTDDWFVVGPNNRYPVADAEPVPETGTIYGILDAFDLTFGDQLNVSEQLNRLSVLSVPSVGDYTGLAFGARFQVQVPGVNDSDQFRELGVLTGFEVEIELVSGAVGVNALASLENETGTVYSGGAIDENGRPTDFGVGIGIPGTAVDAWEITAGNPRRRTAIVLDQAANLSGADQFYLGVYFTGFMLADLLGDEALRINYVRAMYANGETNMAFKQAVNDVVAFRKAVGGNWNTPDDISAKAALDELAARLKAAEDAIAAL